MGLLIHHLHFSKCLIILTSEVVGTHQHMPGLHLLTNHTMLFGEFHHIMRKREDGVVDGLVEIIENTVHAGFCLSDSVALTMGLSLPFVQNLKLQVEIAYQQTLVVNGFHCCQAFLAFELG